MHPIVQNRFRAFNEPLQRVVRYMHLDVKGFVTIGAGNRIDPLSVALSLPFRYKNKSGVANAGQFATSDAIETEWKLLQGQPALAQNGYWACDPLTELELDIAAIDMLVDERLQQNESCLKRQPVFKDFEQWPADAQLGLLSMAWVMGPAFPSHWPRFSAACARMDFAAAADSCKMGVGGNPGVIQRNHSNAQLFHNAASVIEGKDGGFYGPEELYFPQVLSTPTSVEV